MFGFGITSWIKFAVIASILGGAIFLIQDYKRLGVKIERQANQIARLESNVKQKDLIISMTKVSLNELDSECQAAAKRFLEEHDIWKKIEESADPLTDATNWATEPPVAKDNE